MKINNKKNIQIAIYLLIVILILSSLLLGALFLEITHIHYGIAALIFILFILSLWKLVTLKTFSMEVSQHFISIKQSHPFSKGIEVPALEVPLQKVLSFTIEKNMINYFLKISITTKKGKKRFFYNLGILSQKQLEQFNNVLNPIKMQTHNNTRL